MLSLIAAMDRRRAIGRDNGLLFKLPDDMRHFRQVTSGKPVVMGRRTFDSIGRALPGRLNLVLTRDASWAKPGCLTAPSLAEAVSMAGDASEVMIIGGEQVYRQALPLAQRLYLTLVDTEATADAWFPEWDAAAWQQRDCVEHPADDRHPFPFRILTLERRNL